MAHDSLTSHSLTFGTDGIRGNASRFPFTPAALHRLGRALGQFCARLFPQSMRVMIGCDTRGSSPEIKYHLIRGLHAEDILTTDLGVAPTAAVLAALNAQHDHEIGIMITASHNPPEDNGIKFFLRHSGKLDAGHEAILTRSFAALADTSLHDDARHNARPALMLQPPAPHAYYELLSQVLPSGSLVGLHIAVDCANGASYHLAPQIMSFYGATVRCIGVEPNGTNINSGCGALAPQKLQRAVREINAHIGFAFDGDADRIIVVSRDGRICDGDDILALLSSHPLYASQPGLVGTIMSNHGLAQYLAQQGKELIRTPVGDAHVLAALQSRGWLLGGEPSGHILMTDFLPTADGLFVALRLLEHIAATSNWTLDSFEKLPQIITSIPVAQRLDLESGACADIIANYTAQLADGRIIVRYSGTEPVVRIMAEAGTVEQAKKIANALAHELAHYISLTPQPRVSQYAQPHQTS